MLRYINHLLSPGGRHGRLSIMIYHRVLPRPDPLLAWYPGAAEFEAIMRGVREWFNVVPLEQAVDRLATGTLPPRALSITFDDGYADNFDVAFPILRRLEMHATFFIATGFLGGGCMWNDRIIETIRRYPGDTMDLSPLGLGKITTRSLAERRHAIDHLIDRLKYEPTTRRVELTERMADVAQVAVPVDLMMTTDQVRALDHGGMGIGAHTHVHPILTNLQPAAARQEIDHGKRVLEDIVRHPVSLFAYPNGRPGRDYTQTHVELVRQLGFAAACSTAPGVAGRGTDRWQLPRFTPWDRAAWRFGLRLSDNLRHEQHDAA